jgi:tetratricopeptide (TPR) repeat protein
MDESIHELVSRWRDNPTPTMTLALCDALRGSSSVLVQQVGQLAAQKHFADVNVLISVARMYIDSNRYADAQTVLVAAGKQAPRDAGVYRWLGETLLRRGDADRAEKVLQRAIQLGANGADLRVWLERARVFRPMQAKAGTRAVAAEVAHTAQPARELLDSMSENTTDVHLPRPKEFARATPPPPAVAAPPPPAFDEPRQYSKSAQTFPTSFDPPAQSLFGDAAPSSRAPSGSGEIEISVSGVAPLPTSPAAQPERKIPPAHQGTNGFASSPPKTAPPKAASPKAASPRAALPRIAPPEAGSLVPHPRDVLDALAFAGIYEPSAPTGPAAWDRPNAGPKRRGSGLLIGGMVAFVAASIGTYVFYQHKRAEAHLQAEAILDTVEARLEGGKPDTLGDIEQSLSHALELESRSPRAALDWTRERVVVGLLKSGGDVAFEDAMARAKDLGVSEDKYAFAQVASFLFQNDTAGAAAVLPRWDGPAATDAWYQLVAGAALERAGDSRAKDRYIAAAKLDPAMVVAQVGLARVTAIEGDSQQAMKLAKELRLKFPDRTEPVALVALAWGRDPLREDSPAPAEVEQVRARADDLPSGLQFVPHATAALTALDKHANDDARAEVQRGLAVADSPGAAVWLGAIALPLGDEALARKAALAALQLSAAYEPARALAARVALLGGRLDEALKATEDLEATSADVVVVRSAAAYERVDADGVIRGLDALTPEARKLPLVSALALAPEVLAGRLQLDAAKRSALASNDDAPWSDLVAMDVALDGGDLAGADKIALGWGKAAESQPLRAIRLARLARFEGRVDAAEALSLAALDSATVTPRILCERAFVLVAKGRAADVGPLLARYPLVLGPLATWLSAYASASSGAIEAAKGKTASLDPPPPSAPLETRVVAAAALGAMKDHRRGGDYVHELLATGSLHPDLVAAALALGFHRVDHGKRRPTYD